MHNDKVLQNCEYCGLDLVKKRTLVSRWDKALNCKSIDGIKVEGGGGLSR